MTCKARVLKDFLHCKVFSFSGMWYNIFISAVNIMHDETKNRYFLFMLSYSIGKESSNILKESEINGGRKGKGSKSGRS